MKKRNKEYFRKKKKERVSREIALILSSIDDSQKFLRFIDPGAKITNYLFTTKRIPKEPVE